MEKQKTDSSEGQHRTAGKRLSRKDNFERDETKPNSSGQTSRKSVIRDYEIITLSESPPPKRIADKPEIQLPETSQLSNVQNNVQIQKNRQVMLSAFDFEEPDSSSQSLNLDEQSSNTKTYFCKGPRCNLCETFCWINSLPEPVYEDLSDDEDDSVIYVKTRLIVGLYESSETVAWKQLHWEHIKDLLDPAFYELDVRYVVYGIFAVYDGKINGRTVYVYSQFLSVQTDYLLEKQAAKIKEILEKAAHNGHPVIAIEDHFNDKNNRKLTEFKDIWYKRFDSIGAFPFIRLQINCDKINIDRNGVNVDSDFWFAVDGKKRRNDNNLKFLHDIYGNVSEAKSQIRKLMDYIPNTAKEEAAIQMKQKIHGNTSSQKIILWNCCPGLVSCCNKRVPFSYMISQIIFTLVDERKIFNIPTLGYGAKSLFCKIQGKTFGIVANDPFCTHFFDTDKALRGANFLGICDKFKIPVLTFVDGPTILNEVVNCDRSVFYNAYKKIQVPRITIITRRGSREGDDEMVANFFRSDVYYIWNNNYNLDPKQNTSNLEKFSDARSRNLAKIIDPNLPAASQNLVGEMLAPKDTRHIVCKKAKELEEQKKNNTMDQINYY